MKSKKYTAIVEKTKTGFSAYSEELPVFTTGKNITDLINNFTEALNLYYEDDAVKIKSSQIDLKIDLQLFFKYFRMINTNYLANRIGMNPTLISQYVQGRKNPSGEQTKRILKGIHEIGRELSEVNITG